MSRKTIILLTVLFLSPVVIYFLWPSDESRIRKLFREGARAVEQKKIEDVMAKVSYNYMDERGMSYLYIKKGMENIFQSWNEISIQYDITDIEIKEKKATVGIDIRVIASLGQDTGYVVGDAARPVSMKFHLAKERTKWLVVRTEGMPEYY